MVGGWTPKSGVNREELIKPKAGYSVQVDAGIWASQGRQLFEPLTGFIEKKRSMLEETGGLKRGKKGGGKGEGKVLRWEQAIKIGGSLQTKMS